MTDIYVVLITFRNAWFRVLNSLGVIKESNPNPEP